jgi:hypothetical protein
MNISTCSRVIAETEIGIPRSIKKARNVESVASYTRTVFGLRFRTLRSRRKCRATSSMSSTGRVPNAPLSAEV